jgi:thiamine phosphate synthase YjbQ (UPF0047 family)
MVGDHGRYGERHHSGQDRLALGTWQSIALVDVNVDNPDRQVRLSFLPG